MNLQTLLDNFPIKDFQTESEVRPVYEVLTNLRKREISDKKLVKFKDLEEESRQGASCNQLFAYFLIRLISVCNNDEATKTFIQEAVILLCLLRKFLNEKGFQLSQDGNFTHKPSYQVEFCSAKNNQLRVLASNTALSSFFYEYYPCYLSNVLR